MYRFMSGIVMAFAIVFAAACSEQALPPGPALIRIQITPALPVLPVGAEVQLAVSSNVPSWDGFLWRSSDDKIARVSASGLLTGVARGEAFILAKPAADTTVEGIARVVVQ